jgi:superfamily I DNA/RNA helicase
MPARDRAYIRALLRGGHKLTGPAPLRLMTVHGAKGLEADNVLLDGLPLRRDDGGDEEVRVWYVGATRARQRLVTVRADRNPWLL